MPLRQDRARSYLPRVLSRRVRRHKTEEVGSTLWSTTSGRNDASAQAQPNLVARELREPNPPPERGWRFRLRAHQALQAVAWPLRIDAALDHEAIVRRGTGLRRERK